MTPPGQPPVLTASPRRREEAAPAPRTGTVVPALVEALADLGLEPRRARGAEAREALAADGAVVLPGLAVGPGATALGAAEVAGESLRRLYPVRHRGVDGDGVLELHADSFHVVHDVHGDQRLERDPDEDLLLMQLALAPADGGASLVVDAHRLVDRLAEVRPDLHAFMTTTEVDLLGAWSGLPGVPTATRVGLLVEHTRRGRRMVRAGGGIRPLLRTPDHEADARALAELRDVAATVASVAPRVHLEVGDVLVLDNYRCWHGRDPFSGPRQLYVQTARTTDGY